MVEPFANSGDPDQTPRSAASDLGLHCFPVALLGVSRLPRVKIIYCISTFSSARLQIYFAFFYTIRPNTYTLDKHFDSSNVNTLPY